MFKLAKKQLLYSILLIGILIRVVFLSFSNYISRDSITYIQITEKMYASNAVSALTAKENFCYSQRYPLPLYMYMGSRLCYLGLTAQASLILINMISGIFFIFVIFAFMDVFFPNNILNAYVAAGIASIHPTLIQYSINCQREMSYLLFFLLSLLLLIKYYRSPQNYNVLLLGIVGAIGSLLRLEFLEMVILVLLFIILKAKSLKFQIIWHGVQFLLSFCLSFYCFNSVMGTLNIVVTTYINHIKNII